MSLDHKAFPHTEVENLSTLLIMPIIFRMARIRSRIHDSILSMIKQSARPGDVALG